jgi:GT2 family glycosyltransferase
MLRVDTGEHARAAGADVGAAAARASCCIVCGTAPPGRIEHLLRSLATACPHVLVYLVDDARQPGLAALAGRYGAHYRPQLDWPGNARVHNRVLSEAAGAGSAYHLLLGPDIGLPLDAVARMVAYMEQHPDVGLLAPRVQSSDGRLQPLCSLLPGPLELLLGRCFPLLHRSSGRLARYQLHASGYSRVMDVPVPPACCLLMRVETVLRAGMFDERFLLRFDMVDLARRTARIARTVFVPHVTVVRAGVRDPVRGPARAGARGWRGRLVSRWRWCVSAWRYFNKWGWLRDAERDRINARALRQLGPARGRLNDVSPAGTDVAG